MFFSLSERCEAEGGGASVSKSRLQDCRRPRLPANPAPQQPGRAQVNKKKSNLYDFRELKV